MGVIVVEITGGSKAIATLTDIERSLSPVGEAEPFVRIGFLRGATYPEDAGGQPVALIAALNEFGVPERGQPPRPFFRNMIAERGKDWPKQLAKQLESTNFDGPLSLGRMGMLIANQLQESIRSLQEPPLSPVTIARKGFSKPLIDTSHMLNSVDYEVET